MVAENKHKLESLEVKFYLPDHMPKMIIQWLLLCTIMTKMVLWHLKMMKN